MVKTYLTYFFVTITFAAFCQSNAVYPDVLSVYFYNMASINVGYIPDNGKTDFALGYKFHQGQLQKVNTLSFAASKIRRTSKENAHSFRLLAYNEQSGPYISSPKGYLNYAYELHLSEETRLFSGLALGVASVYYSAPTFSSSAFLPDGSLGFGIKHRKVSFGVSALQVFNPTSSRFGGTYRLGRYYQTYLTAEKELDIDWRMNGYALWRKLPGTEDDFGLALSLTAKEAITLGASCRYKGGMSFFTAFHIPEEENRLLISLNYNAAPIFTSLPSWQNSFEIGLGYRLE